MPAVLVTVRAVADEAAARTVAPFAVLFPGGGLGGHQRRRVLRRGRRRGGWRCWRWPPGGTRSPGRWPGGCCWGSSLFLSFGLAAAGLIALAVVLVRTTELGRAGVARVLGSAAVGVVAVVAVFTLGGYWWFDGIVVDAQRVMDGAAYTDRIAHAHYFLWSNAAAAAIAAGPAVVAGLAGLRGRLLFLPLAAIVGMAVSDGSGLVLGETERIWLPFVVWLLPATATLPPRERSGSGWPCPRCSRSPSRSSSAAPGDSGSRRSGSVAKARIPSAKPTRARKPSSCSARAGSATTWRTSPSRYVAGDHAAPGPPIAAASAPARSPIVCGSPERR